MPRRRQKPIRQRLAARQVAIPTEEENRALIRRAQDGTADGKDRIAARNEIIERNMPMVWAVVKRLGRGEFQDLCQQGVFGMMRAIELFDLDRGVKFVTFASYWIYQAVYRHLMESVPVRVPSYLWCNGRTKMPNLQTEAGMKSAAECRAKAGAAMGVIYSAERTHCGRGSHGEPIFIRDVIPAREEAEPPDADELRLVAGALADLPPVQRWVIERRFGLGCPAETLEEVGRKLEVTRERVRQIQRDAIAQMRVLVGA